jgi:hypothetical protein
MSDVYTLAMDGFFPSLRLLRVYVKNAVIKTVSTDLPATTSLRMPKLETFDLYLKWRQEATEEEEEVKWAAVETLICHSVMPRLRRCSLFYNLSTGIEIRDIFQSPLFNNDERHIHVRFALYLNTSIFIDSSDITNIFDIRFACYNQFFVQYVSIFSL